MGAPHGMLTAASKINDSIGSPSRQIGSALDKNIQGSQFDTSDAALNSLNLSSYDPASIRPQDTVKAIATNVQPAGGGQQAAPTGNSTVDKLSAILPAGEADTPLDEAGQCHNQCRRCD